MDADACDNQFDGRMAIKTQASSAEFSTSRKNPCSMGRADTSHFLRLAFPFFFATVSAAGTVCSGNENNLTKESSSWILCIVCETLAMIRDF